LCCMRRICLRRSCPRAKRSFALNIRTISHSPEIDLTSLPPADAPQKNSFIPESSTFKAAFAKGSSQSTKLHNSVANYQLSIVMHQQHVVAATTIVPSISIMHSFDETKVPPLRQSPSFNPLL
jgi:hypothetical protein